MTNEAPASWQSLEQELCSDTVKLSGPVTGERMTSLLDALGRAELFGSAKAAERGRELQQSLTGLVSQLRRFDSISRCPILAITGLLNAGKSSLLATYLSPANRARVLRGVGHQAGTHRFVLWLPEVWWNDAQLLGVLTSFITELFGHPPERLADDPAQAALQYNGHILQQETVQASSAATGQPASAAAPRTVSNPAKYSSEAAPSDSPSPSVDALSVPLIAYDSQLDKLKLGLIDCPDIQTGFHAAQSVGVSGDSLAESRRQRLNRIGRLCSAFVVVAKLSSLHDDGLLQVLGTLRDAMPGVPRMLAVNKLKARYAPDVVFEESRGLVERYHIDAVFAAYDFRSALAESRLPPLPQGMNVEDDQPLPIFFEIGEPRNSQPSPVVSTDASTEVGYLFDLGRRLDAGALSQASCHSLVARLKSKALEAADCLDEAARESELRLRDAWRAVAEACYEFMAERDAGGHPIGLRLQASPAIMAQMAESLQRTAPMWMRAGLVIDRTARQLHQAIGDSAARFKILQTASKSVTQFAKRFRRGEGARVVTPERLRDAILAKDLQEAFAHLPLEQLTAGCAVAIKRFAAEDESRLNPTELDAWSQTIWRDMSWKDKLRKGTQPLAVAMAPLLAVVLIPFDAGGSAVLVFASTKELLVAAGLAAAMGPVLTGGETTGIIHRETPWRQLSDLFAVACDSLGLPRPPPAELPSVEYLSIKKQLLESKLPVKPSILEAAFLRPHIDTRPLRQLIRQLAMECRTE